MTSEEVVIKILEEVSKIRQLMEVIARKTLKEDLERVATTPERRRIWALCDGSLSTEEIARKAGVTQRTVQRFVKELRRLDLISIEKRGYPKRKFDYVPSDWEVETGDGR